MYTILPVLQNENSLKNLDSQAHNIYCGVAGWEYRYGPCPLGHKEIVVLLVPPGKAYTPSDYWLAARVGACPGKVVKSNHLYI